VLRYLSGAVEYWLLYERSGGVRLVGFTYVDWAGCAEDRKSTSGCCFSIGLCIISWFSWKQKSVALSSAEAEYMVASWAVLSRNLYFYRREGKQSANWHNRRLSYDCHLNRMSLSI
jgi:hypothetical protein